MELTAKNNENEQGQTPVLIQILEGLRRENTFNK